MLSFFIYTFIVLVHTWDSPLITSVVSCLVRVFFLQSHPPSPTTHTLIPWVRGIYVKRISDHITPLNKILQCLPSRTWPLFPSGCALHLLSFPPCPNDFRFPDPSVFSFTSELFYALSSTQNAISFPLTCSLLCPSDDQRMPLPRKPILLPPG